jgi:hypothetical protein
MSVAMMHFDVGPAQHDPGGKVRLPLQPGVRGSALFSECGRYRYALRRDWGEVGEPFVLWIACNPSVANPTEDDPTVRKEINWTRAWGFTSLVKCNVCDYRATDPKALASVNPRSANNLPFIIEMAGKADRIVCAWGALPKSLRRYADDVVMALRGHRLWCMGKTKGGEPRHPLYLPNSSQCAPWP